MRNGLAEVAVILPSIGRPSLSKALHSVYKQDLVPKEIVVIDDSFHQKIEFIYGPTIRILRTGGGKGPSYSRNLGISQTKSRFIAFLDDDDIWLNNHLSFSTEIILKLNLDAHFSSANTRKGVRPKITISGNKDPLIEVYRNIKLFNSPYFLSLPGLVVKREVTNHINFNERLYDREDLWFIHKIYEFGFKIRQSNLPTITVNENYRRKLSRSDIQVNLNWFYRLMTIDKLAAKKFLKYIALRNEIFRLHVVRMFLLIKELISIKSVKNKQVIFRD